MLMDIRKQTPFLKGSLCGNNCEQVTGVKVTPEHRVQDVSILPEVMHFKQEDASKSSQHQAKTDWASA